MQDRGGKLQQVKHITDSFTAMLHQGGPTTGLGSHLRTESLEHSPGSLCHSEKLNFLYLFQKIEECSDQKDRALKAEFWCFRVVKWPHPCPASGVWLLHPAAPDCQH